MGCIRIPGSKGSKEFSFIQSKIESHLTQVCLPNPWETGFGSLAGNISLSVMISIVDEKRSKVQ